MKNSVVFKFLTVLVAAGFISAVPVTERSPIRDNNSVDAKLCNKINKIKGAAICKQLYGESRIYVNYEFTNSIDNPSEKLYKFPIADLSSFSLNKISIIFDGLSICGFKKEKNKINNCEEYKNKDIFAEVSDLKLPKDIKELNISYSTIGYIDNKDHYLPSFDFSKYNQLKSLKIDMYGNGAFDFHINKNGLKLPKSLTDLEILGINDIENGFDFISDAHQLQNLILNVPLKPTIPDSILKLENLKSLQLLRNGLTSFPDEIGSLSSVENLVINYNDFVSISEKIGELKNLKQLNLSSNKIESLPEEIGNLENLKELDLQYNNIEKIPNSIGNLKNLEILNISENKIIEITSSIGTLENLNKLDVSENKITNISSEIGNLKNLINLNLKYNNLSEIPNEIGNLESLEILSINNNIFNKFPTQIGNLKSLIYLNASSNNISEIPKEIGNLTNLKSLNLDNNKFESIPQEISNCKQLKYLSIDSSTLSRIPDFFSTINTNDCELEINVNEDTCIPQAVRDNICLEYDNDTMCTDETSEQNDCPLSKTLGYPCCSHCKSIYKDNNGYWGVENKEWCIISDKCSLEGDVCWSLKFGYPCCDHCKVKTTDTHGSWGIMNKEWCGIPETCTN
eukprot:jgi/Orpsp1_1/1185239/evm.model.c7180000092890.1